MRGVEGQHGFIDTDFVAGQPQQYMWHFWGNAEDYVGKRLSVKATDKAGKTAPVFSGLLRGANNGAVAHTPSTMSLPASGLWRLAHLRERPAEGFHDRRREAGWLTERRPQMGHVTLQMNVTLDGCCDHTQVIADEELHSYATELLDQADAALFGRLTYQLMEGAWPAVASSGAGPEAIVDFARKLDRKPKYVVSRTLAQLSWQNAFLLRGPEDVARLKAEGKRLLVTGGPGLGSTLAALGLVDEYHLLIQPIVAGHGPRLLEGIHSRLDLKLAGTRTFGSGVVLLRYTAD
jgi:dihydrofolate reductase